MEKITLPNGVRILLEPVPALRSASASIWVANGSRYETPAENGISHFIEHMVFKGTQAHTAAQIAADMDRHGGQVNAYTTKEYTCFYLRTPDTHLDDASALLCDMFFNSLFRDTDIALEKSVIYEEIDMYEDTPDDLVVERLGARVFDGSPLAMPIIGSRESLAPMSGADLHRYMKGHYVPENTLVAIAGSITDSVVALYSELFAKMTAAPLPQAQGADYRPDFVATPKPIEQNHLCLAFRGLPYGSPQRFAAQVYNNILGGGMSSRLFQKVREDAGLCYSVYSFLSAHADTGFLGVYTALGAASQAKALALIREVTERLAQDGPDEEELDRAREQIKANLLLGLESTTSRMNQMARAELLLGRVMSLEEILAAYDAVGRQELLDVGQSLCDFDTLSFSAVGKVEAAERYRELLAKK